MAKYICPVCGYNELDQPAWDTTTGVPSFNIYPSCGCELGYHDATTRAKLIYLRNWVQQGTSWFRPEIKPSGWNLKEQLARIGIDLNDLNQ